MIVLTACTENKFCYQLSHLIGQFELRSTDPKQRFKVEVEGNETNENSNYSPEPQISSFVFDQ